MQLVEFILGLHGSQGSEPWATSTPSEIPSSSVSKIASSVHKKLSS